MSQTTQPWRFVPLSVNDGFTNMAIDEAILSCRVKGLVPSTIRLYQWDPSTVSIGRHQSVKLEVDEAEIGRRGFQLVRRISGGGAVLHSRGREITYAVVSRLDELGAAARGFGPAVRAAYETILTAIQRAVAALSMRALPGTIHCPALLVDGKKISGNAQCIKGNYVLQHGTILLSVDPDEMYSVLKPPEGVSKGRMVRSVKAKVVGIEEHLGRAVSPAELEAKFKDSIARSIGIELVDGDMAAEEIDLVDALREKYASAEWRYKHP
ncbi:MAG: lipoate--protein ligase family protein [Candidatus Lokiarchaeota archaeon]|nr:lipoate--protein ligase family protein [Candidatus Lokiarchaeota archaeon]